MNVSGWLYGCAFCCAFLCVLGGCGGNNSDSATARLHVDGNHIVDEQGAQIILRGYSLAAKQPPFRPVQQASDFDPLVEAGANFVRLHFSWEAAEPELAQYDESYFTYYRQVVDWAWAHKLYVIIDFHNNAFSRYAANGCGMGFPSWAITPEVTLATPKENGECVFIRDISAAMVSEEGYKIWRDFLDDNYGARTRFFELVTRLAQDYRSHPAVIGMDFNEPSPVVVQETATQETVVQETATQETGNVFDYALWLRFVNAWIETLAAADPDLLVFVQPSPTSHVFPYSADREKMPRPSGSNIVYAPHVYEVGGILLGKPLGDIKDYLAGVLATQQEWQTPVLIGEWGGRMSGPNANSTALEDQAVEASRYFDLQGWSGARWNYSPGWTPERLDYFHDEDFSCFDELHALRPGCPVRAYVQRIPGQLVSMEITQVGEAKNYTAGEIVERNASSRLQIIWQNQPEKGTLTVFAPSHILFPDSVGQISVIEGSPDCQWDIDQRYLYCTGTKTERIQIIVQ